ncbi:hypothetical protein [Achromobacter sp.]|uniref:hypothetical protein n=1 Tax=Achromobacter sp. TaxID=134375 RepID=UPI003C718E3E
MTSIEKLSRMRMRRASRRVARDPAHLQVDATEGVKSIAELDLTPSAKAGAEALLAQFPSHVKFTSGRRDIADQARAMAPNVLKERRWIEKTYKDTPQRAALQAWVDANLQATDAATIAAGLEAIMRSWTAAQQRNFSRHFLGDAFDIAPIAGDIGKQIKDAIPKLPRYQWHTFDEGGLEIWHIQFQS